MSVRVAVHHKTEYHYDRLVSLSPHVFRLRPAPHCRTSIEGYTLKIKPENHFINWQQDPFGNYLARVIFPEKTTLLSIEVEVIANLVVINPFDFFVDETAKNFPFEYGFQLENELVPYREIKESGPMITEWISALDRSSKPVVDFLVYINQKIYNDISYTIRMEVGVQTSEETLSKKLGSCRDSAWFMVQVLRHLGLAARFVSGYLVQLTADVKPLDGPRGPETDFTDLHAWTEVYIPGAGWIGLDPTSGLFAGEGHIPLASTPDHVSAAAVSGAKDFCETTFIFENAVIRLEEAPRVTKPYTEDQWQDIKTLGLKVDEDLLYNDVRMTMGGEPTFVSIDDMEAEEWSTKADGPHKRELADTLMQHLRTAFGSGGFVHNGQGKWYPGEDLPRWQLALYWRKDGIAMWKDYSLLDGYNSNSGYTVSDAENFINTLSDYLDVSREYILAAYEDVFYFLWEEGKLPYNSNPLKSDLKDPSERKRLSQLLNNGLNNAIGFALPLGWDKELNQWESNLWRFRSGNLYLIPGNSPLGLRLPLKSLPKLSEKEEEENILIEADMFAPVASFEELGEKIEKRYNNVLEIEKGKHTEIISNGPQTDLLSHEVPLIRTSLCIECREGKLYIFLPPLSNFEQYLELISCVEATAKRLSLKVILEGYSPPKDNRVQQIILSSDPGVLEVNIHPSKNWAELLHNYETLYHQAFLSRLGTEKFMLDGRHTGTGGGNHITIGGENPKDSPILRRPDMLRSLVTYWQHHPGLSYLFSSEFIGPTSQAPRVDEGRDEKLYELEIAFSQIPENQEAPFWLVDRLFSHLLVDITGNTHRAEFCIDKLYSPDSSSGRLGILEFRAFDMPPHFRMSMVQMLLIRALVSMFWKRPYKHKLVRWGTELHDKFMIAHYVREDLKKVVLDLEEAGYKFDLNWLEPFFEFRFPFIGKIDLNGITLELRKAIEPWHVLGEEMSRSGTARFVDSSLERVQLKLFGLTDSRYEVACNGCKIPVISTGTHGEYVAGIRYRAWQPPSALHPTIGIDSPLTFDIVDTWNGRSIGGCVYHVVHPGGRSYDTFPVNSYEAESRRSNCFWDFGHTPETIINEPGKAELKRSFVEKREALPVFYNNNPVVNPEYPHTLDLRQFKNK